MKKLGILTFTSNFNMGSFWQAYATLTLLRARFPRARVDIINYHRESIRSEVQFNRWIVPNKWHIYPPWLLKDLFRRRRYRQTQNRFLGINPAKGCCCDSLEKATAFLNRQAYDCIFVGSDTVLGFEDRHYRANVPPVYWLPQSVSASKVMISASLGTRPPQLDRLSSSVRKDLAEALEGFAFLGVRDELTRDTLTDLNPGCSEKIQLLPDPTFFLDVDPRPAGLFLKKKGIDLSRPVIGIDIPATLPGFKEYIEEQSARGCQLISWRNRPRRGIIDCSEISPIIWAGMYKFFHLTLTNRFHAAVFCMKNLTPVLAIDVKPNRYLANGWSKSVSLLSQFKLEETNHTNIERLKSGQDLAAAAAKAVSAFKTTEVIPGLFRFRNRLTDYTDKVRSQLLHMPAAR